MRALVHSGGGRKGAWGVGVLKVLTAAPFRRDWEYLSGTSVGAINLSWLAMFPMGKSADAVRSLETLWLNLRTKKVWKHWFWGPLAGLWRESFFNSRPLWKLLERDLDPEKLRVSEHSLRVGCVDYGSGAYFEATLAEVLEKGLPWWKYVAASSSYPSALCPVVLPEGFCGDGGVISATPLKGAIDAGCDEIDVVLTAPLKPKPMPVEDSGLSLKLSALSILVRTIDLMAHEAMVRDLQRCAEVNELVRAGKDGKHREVKLNVFVPQQVLTSSPLDALQFDPVRTKELIRIGEEDARRIAL